VRSETRPWFPDGYARFRPDLGAVLKRRRKEEQLSQGRLAKKIGVARETLSRIECGRAWPRPDTLYKLMETFDLQMPDVWVRASSGCAPGKKDDLITGRRAQLGIDLRKGRLTEGLLLRALAALCGTSAAQLSRIERSLASRSRFFEMDRTNTSQFDDAGRDHFNHPELQRLARLGALV